MTVSVTPPGLRIGIDGDALRVPITGVGRYVLEIGRALDEIWPDATFYLYTRLPPDRLILPSNRWVVRQEPIAGLRRLPSFLWMKLRLRHISRRDRLDLFWAPRTLHPNLPRPIFTVATVHDLNHLIVPWSMQYMTLWSHRLWFERDARGAHLLIANSHGTAGRLEALLGLKIPGVVRPGVDAGFRPLNELQLREARETLRGRGISGKYILAVATLEPRKNVEVLWRAFVELVEGHELEDYQLVIAGTSGWRSSDLDRRMRASMPGKVILTGYAPDSIMPSLYGCASALVCASYYEGFGLPVSEARAFGTPVVVTDVPELREAGGPAAIVVSPTVAGLKSGITRALASGRTAEPDLVDTLSWRSSAATFAQLLTSAMRASSDVGSTP